MKSSKAMTTGEGIIQSGDTGSGAPLRKQSLRGGRTQERACKRCGRKIKCRRCHPATGSVSKALATALRRIGAEEPEETARLLETSGLLRG